MGNRPRKPVTTPATRERRVSLRVGVDTYIRVAVVHEPDARKVHGWVRNLSTGGMFVETADPLPIDAPVRVDALARSDGDLIHFKADGWVAYAGPNGLGIQFDDLDEAMQTRLTALIERFDRQSREVSDSPKSGPAPAEPDRD